MTENRTPPGSAQGASTSPNGKTGNFIEQIAGSQADRVWIAESSDMGGGFYSPGRYQSLAPDSAHYYCSALMRIGATTRSIDNFEAAFVLVMDDVKTVVSIDPKTGKPDGVPKKAVDEFCADGFGANASFIVQTSDTPVPSYHYAWRIKLERDYNRWAYFIDQTKQHKDFGPGFTDSDPVHLFRNPSGINPKPGRNNFQTKLTKPYDGSEWDLDELAAAFGIDMSPAAIMAWAKQKPTLDADEYASPGALREIMKMIPNDSYFDDRGKWAAIGFALKNASQDDPEVRDLWIEWDNPTKNPDAARFWDTARDPKAGLSTLRIEIERRHGENSKEREHVSQVLAREAFPPIDEAEVKAAMPGKKGETQPEEDTFALTGWNPWRAQRPPAFPVDELPSSVRTFVIERAVLTGSDVSAWAMTSILGMSTMLDHQVTLQPKLDPEYRVSPLLWSLLVGSPSTRKSAPLSAIERLLVEYDKRDAQRRKTQVDGLIDIVGMTLKEAETAVPHARRRVLNDTTTERLCEVLSHQSCGVGLFRDELSGWIGAMDKYGGPGKGAQQDRSVWIRAHGGGPYTQHRMTGTRVVENLSASIMGAIQPDALPKDLDIDGLLQRFIPVMMAPASPDQDSQGDPLIMAGFRQVLDMLDSVSMFNTYTLDDQARALRKSFADEMTEAADMTEPSPAFGTFLGKQERTLNSLSLILHLADGCVGDSEIPLATVERALRIIKKFIIPHAEAFYESINRSWVMEVRSLAAGIIRLSGQKITHSKVNEKCSASRKMDGGEFRKAMLPFQANGWIIALDPSSPLNKHWWVHPKLRDIFGQELKDHEAMVVRVKANFNP